MKSKKVFKIIFIIFVLIILVSIISFIIIKENNLNEESSNSKITIDLEIGKNEYGQLEIVPILVDYTGKTSLDKLYYIYYLKCTDDTDFHIVKQEIGATNYAEFPKTGNGKYSVKVEIKEHAEGKILASAVQENIYYEEIACCAEKTKILTEDGLKNIEDIKIGDLVYSINLESNQKELKEVAGIYMATTTSFFKIKVGDDVIRVTPNSKFYIQDKGWVNSYKLKCGDKIFSKDNSNLVVTEIEHEILDNPIKIYNIKIEDNYNYLITSQELLIKRYLIEEKT